MLKNLVGAKNAKHAEKFMFAILETADTSASEADILTREAHWKRVLNSREFGLNAN